MIYVALLRGINVGGNARVEMIRLKNVFESLGFLQVTTYINSGNVIFSSTIKGDTLDTLIEEAIEKEFQFHVPVVIRSQENIKKLTKTIPTNWTNDTDQKTDVMFLWEEVNSKSTLENLVLKKDYDTVEYISGAIVWNVKRKTLQKVDYLK
jgi:uncharacterized protein (DUF1697 family)